MAATNTTAAADSTINSVVGQSLVESFRMPNAIPRFSERTMLNNPGITGTVSMAETLLSTIHLLTRSSASTSAAVPYAFTRESTMQNLVDGCRAGQADGWETRVAADIQRVLPAALALASRRALDRHANRHAELVAVRPFQFHLRHDEQRGQLCRVLLQQRVQVAVRPESHARFQRRPDQFLVARRIQMLQYDIPHLHETVPVGGAFPGRLVEPGRKLGGLREERQVDALCVSHVAPHLLGGEDSQI